MKNFLTFVASCVFTVVAIFFALNVPASWFNLAHVTPRAGSAFTTLAGSNQLSSFPTTYNANLTVTANTSAPNTFSGLETDAAGFISQASSTVYNGLHVDTLSLQNALTAANGGTGSTTLAIHQVLVGNATGAVGVVSGTGNSGQALVSNGASSNPTWQSITFDNSLSYALSGQWAFSNSILSNGTTTIACSGTSNWLKLNGIQYVCPASQGSAQTSLVNDGAGNLSWKQPSSYKFVTATSTSLSLTSASATTTSITFPAGILGATSTVQVTGTMTCTQLGGSGHNCEFLIRDQAGDTFLTGGALNIAASCSFSFIATIIATSSSAEMGVSNNTCGLNDASQSSYTTFNLASVSGIYVVGLSSDMNMPVTLNHVTIVVTP